MSANDDGWIGVDLDGTLAEYDNVWKGPEHIGEPIPAMVDRVKQWIAEGKQVRIFTARVWFPRGNSNDTDKKAAMDSMLAIQRWCSKVFGAVLPITCEKDYKMLELWDDRAVQIISNTGMRADQGEAPKSKNKSRVDVDVRDAAVAKACKIVRKFPQIEQQVLAPMLTREIAKALYAAAQRR